MHELSIVMNIIEIAEAQVEAHDATHVESIDLEIGELATVEMDAFHFAWNAGIRNTSLEHAEKTIHRTKGKANCTECHSNFPVNDLYFSCPTCGGVECNIVQGRELRVKSLTINSIN